MRVRREVLVGLAAFVAFATLALSVGLRSDDATIRSFSLLVAIGAGGSMSIMVGLAYHLSRGPRHAAYERTEEAWGMAEMEERERP